jgi:hypothetical protein
MHSSCMSLPARKFGGRDRTPVALHDRAIADLRFIRETMERSASFTAVSGRGGVAMGLVALVAAKLASSMPSPQSWMGVWMSAAAVSFSIALWATGAKARAAGTPLLVGAGRKFIWNVIPPLLVGGLLTLALARAGLHGALPGMWLLLYGTAVLAGGAFSVRVVPLMGSTFMAVGAVALFAPEQLANLFMAIGFGGLHIVFGLVIWRKHGG